MPCRAWAPFGLLALLTFRVADLWRTGELDPITLALVPVAAAMVVWLVRQPGSCGGAECVVPGVDDLRPAEEPGAHRITEEPVADERAERATVEQAERGRTEPAPADR